MFPRLGRRKNIRGNVEIFKSFLQQCFLVCPGPKTLSKREDTNKDKVKLERYLPNVICPYNKKLYSIQKYLDVWTVK